jgi:transcriptional regulator with XRE-family HTH domain
MNTEKQALSEYLKQSLGAEGYSQANLADKIGYTSGTLKGWIRRNTFPINALEKIRETLGWEAIDVLQLEYQFETTKPIVSKPNKTYSSKNKPRGGYPSQHIVYFKSFVKFIWNYLLTKQRGKC